jgi:deoxycytidine triphosphate deaminase
MTSFLVDHEIKKAIKEGHITIEPFKEENLGPNSYDLTLANKFRYFIKEEEVLLIENRVPKTEEAITNIVKGRERIHLLPNESIITMTNELVGVGNGFIGIVFARSNLSLALSFHFSSLIDTGYYGILCTRIQNPLEDPIMIPVNQRILQVMFVKTSEVNQTYFQRKLSKNIDQLGKDVPQYKIDKEWLQ